MRKLSDSAMSSLTRCSNAEADGAGREVSWSLEAMMDAASVSPPLDGPNEGGYGLAWLPLTPRLEDDTSLESSLTARLWTRVTECERT